MKPKKPHIVWAGISEVLTIFAFAGLALGQQVLENPEKPLAKNAGRVLGLQEVWRITDESGQFYFKYAAQLQTAGDGSLFIADENELLHFAADGEFIRNLYKKGEGPGEISSSFSYFVRGTELLIWDSSKRKLWSIDFDGELRAEFKVPNAGYTGFLGARKDDFVFTKLESPRPAEKKGLMDLPQNIFLTSMDGTNERPIFTFYFKGFVSPQGSRSWTPPISVLTPDGKYIIGSHDTVYAIQVVDIESGKLIRMFNRRYPRIKHKEDDFERQFNAKTGAPPYEFEPDVRGLRVYGSQIWIRTSTTDPKKGDLWDVFSMDGKFLDSLYIGPKRTLLRVDPEHIFVTEKTADETLALVKYKIVG
jgi:hypothetical protein